jgi:periplasmic divalent cation tolerance protein
MSDEYVIVLTTVPADGDLGQRLATALVAERLAACVNLLAPMESTYRWEGQVSLDRERQVIVKTTRACLEGVMARLRDLHTYDVPELIVLPFTEGGDAYLRWIKESTSV